MPSLYCFGMAIPPFFRNPITDFSEALYTPVDGHSTNNPFLAKREMNLFNCLEAYGINQGEYKCAAYYEDYREVLYGHRMMKRVKLIKEERERQYKQGKIKDRTTPNPPRYDSFFWNPLGVH